MYEYIHENFEMFFPKDLNFFNFPISTRPLFSSWRTNSGNLGGQRYRSQTLIRYAKNDRAALHSLCHAQVMRVDQRSCRSRRRSFLARFPTNIISKKWLENFEIVIPKYIDRKSEILLVKYKYHITFRFFWLFLGPGGVVRKKMFPSRRNAKLFIQVLIDSRSFKEYQAIVGIDSMCI